MVCVQQEGCPIGYLLASASAGQTSHHWLI